MGFTQEMAKAGPRLQLIQVPAQASIGSTSALWSSGVHLATPTGMKRGSPNRYRRDIAHTLFRAPGRRLRAVNGEPVAVSASPLRVRNRGKPRHPGIWHLAKH